MHTKKKEKTVVFKSFDYQTTAFEIAQTPVQTSPVSESKKNITTLCCQLGRSHVSPCRQLLVYHIKAHLAAFNHLQ